MQEGVKEKQSPMNPGRFSSSGPDHGELTSFWQIRKLRVTSLKHKEERKCGTL